MTILPRTEAESQDTLIVRDSRTRGWFWVDNELIDELGPELGPYGLAIYMALCKHADNNDQTCYPSYATLARETGMSRRQTMRAIRKIEGLGLITIEPRTTEAGDPTSNLFRLLAKSNWRGSDSQSPPSDRESPGVVTGSHQGSDSQSPGVVTHSHPNNPHPSNPHEEKDSINNNGAGENSPIADAAGADLSLSQFLTDNGIRGKKLKDVLKLNPPVEHARRWFEYARNNPDVKKPAGFVISMLESQEPPPQKRNGRWYTDEELSQNFVPPGVNAWEWKKNQQISQALESKRRKNETFFDPYSGKIVRKDPETGELVPVKDADESERIKAEIHAKHGSLTPEQEKVLREFDAKHSTEEVEWEMPDFIKD